MICRENPKSFSIISNTATTSHIRVFTLKSNYPPIPFSLSTSLCDLFPDYEMFHSAFKMPDMKTCPLPGIFVNLTSFHTFFKCHLNGSPSHHPPFAHPQLYEQSPSLFLLPITTHVAHLPVETVIITS